MPTLQLPSNWLTVLILLLVTLAGGIFWLQVIWSTYGDAIRRMMGNRSFQDREFDLHARARNLTSPQIPLPGVPNLQLLKAAEKDGYRTLLLVNRGDKVINITVTGAGGTTCDFTPATTLDHGQTASLVIPVVLEPTTFRVCFLDAYGRSGTQKYSFDEASGLELL